LIPFLRIGWDAQHHCCNPIGVAQYYTTTSEILMIKYDNIWSQAEPEALQLKRSGYTPQQVCTALAKKYFGDT